MVLEREPTNFHDKNAIKVILKKKHIGYIRAIEAKKIAVLMDKGHEVKAYLKAVREFEDYDDNSALGCDIVIFVLNKIEEVNVI
ncbi:HIRAN domain-containing protein [Anaerobacillus isosaccharinicus]|uniref:HIRAN domain-containing protein n=1 Tax=Anaerobacillus isosaccharinicus TaxID=1532552 RepID=A0A7S7LCL0_9BACI|nr:HIRAN domain-containing protein [Anaerobacillus isosaccharinicus]